MTTEPDTDFRSDLQKLLNGHCRENCSNTPDLVLAQYLSSCLDAFDAAVRARQNWYGSTDAVEFAPLSQIMEVGGSDDD